MLSAFTSILMPVVLMPVVVLVMASPSRFEDGRGGASAARDGGLEAYPRERTVPTTTASDPYSSHLLISITPSSLLIVHATVKVDVTPHDFISAKHSFTLRPAVAF